MRTTSKYNCNWLQLEGIVVTLWFGWLDSSLILNRSCSMNNFLMSSWLKLKCFSSVVYCLDKSVSSIPKCVLLQEILQGHPPLIKVSFCQDAMTDGMVTCTAGSWQLRYFHLKCLGLKHFPRTQKYLCPSCGKLDLAAKCAQKRLASKDRMDIPE